MEIDKIVERVVRLSHGELYFDDELDDLLRKGYGICLKTEDWKNWCTLLGAHHCYMRGDLKLKFNSKDWKKLDLAKYIIMDKPNSSTIWSDAHKELIEEIIPPGTLNGSSEKLTTPDVVRNDLLKHDLLKSDWYKNL